MIRTYQGGLISEGNSSTTPLAIEATFTGVGERSPHHDILVTVATDADGTLHVDLGSVEGIWDMVHTTAILANTPVDVAFRKGTRWARVRFVNGSDVQSFFRLHTEFGQWNATS